MGLVLNPQDWFELFMHFAVLSLLGIGGAITTAPDMHRFLVSEKNWLTDTSFSSCIALAQSAPGPNVLFVALMGWQVGVNAGGGLSAGAHAWWLGLLGMMLTMLGIMLPSSVLTYKATKWAHVNRDLISVQTFKSGMAPIVIGLLVSTGWLLSAAHLDLAQDWKIWLVTAVATLVMLRTSIHLLWLIAAGGILGAAGLL
ncbi:MAG: chromate transporter [Betaproteobacteria bacterium]|nr:chromate transporter [Betaproteobacteria bacterium]